MLIKQQCFRAGFSDVTLLYRGLSSLNADHNYDIIFIDENIDEHRAGGEVVDGLLATRIIKPTTAVVMVGTEANTNTYLHEYDNPLMLLEYLTTPFSEKGLLDTIQVLARAVTLFKPTLTFISNGKLSFAFKALNAIPKGNITSDLIETYSRLKINLTLEMGQFAKVLAICSKPNVKEQAWSLWPSLKANYELGNWEHYKQSLFQESFLSLPCGSVKLFWQLRILLQQHDFEGAIELVNTYPSTNMPTTMVRLVFMILILAQRFDDAQKFMERKIRLAPDNSELLGQLTVSLCSVYLYEYLPSSSDDKAVLMSKLKRRLAEFKKMLVVKKFAVEVTLIEIYIVIIDADGDLEQLIKIKNKLEQLTNLNNSPIITCRIAYAWYIIGEHERAFDLLVDIDACFSFMPLGSERLILSMVQTEMFNSMYDESQRFDTYRRLGDAHLQQQRYKLACKAYVRALQHKADSKVKQKLSNAMEDADMPHFSGYKLNKESEA